MPRNEANMTPITLSKKELDEVLFSVNITCKEYSAGRICRLLAEKPATVTVDVNRLCSVVNISDIVNKFINPRIHHLGLVVACTRPPKVILNRFNQRTGQVHWAFYRLQIAANDAQYDQLAVGAEV
jgi:hypothetical protein